jgi:hypothetical protein
MHFKDFAKGKNIFIIIFTRFSFYKILKTLNKIETATWFSTVLLAFKEDSLSMFDVLSTSLEGLFFLFLYLSKRGGGGGGRHMVAQLTH